MRAYLRGLERAEKALQANLQKYLPLWKIAIPEDLVGLRDWDFSRFGRGERFVYQPLPRAEFDEIMVDTQRWGLDDYMKVREFEKLVYRVAE